MRAAFLLLLMLFVLPPVDCGGTPDPEPAPVASCEVCDQTDPLTCGGVPSLCAKTGNSFCCAR
jgi:hypothetical protein